MYCTCIVEHVITNRVCVNLQKFVFVPCMLSFVMFIVCYTNHFNPIQCISTLFYFTITSILCKFVYSKYSEY